MAFVSLTFGGWKGSLTTSFIYSIKIRLFKLCMFIESSFINFIFLTTYTFHLVLKINLHIVIQYNFKFQFQNIFEILLFRWIVPSFYLFWILIVSTNNLFFKNQLFVFCFLAQYLSLVISSIYFTLLVFSHSFWIVCFIYLFSFYCYAYITLWILLEDCFSYIP